MPEAERDPTPESSIRRTPYLRRRVRGFGHAFRGLAWMLRTQEHARLHALATVLVVAAALYFKVPPQDWALLALAMGGVWAMEAANSALESLADAVHPEFHPLVGRAKDMAAAAVLLMAFAAVAVGTAVFWDEAWALLGRPEGM